MFCHVTHVESTVKMESEDGIKTEKPGIKPTIMNITSVMPNVKKTIMEVGGEQGDKTDEQQTIVTSSDETTTSTSCKFTA